MNDGISTKNSIASLCDVSKKLSTRLSESAAAPGLESNYDLR